MKYVNKVYSGCFETPSYNCDGRHNIWYTVNVKFNLIKYLMKYSSIEDIVHLVIQTNIMNAIVNNASLKDALNVAKNNIHDDFIYKNKLCNKTVVEASKITIIVLN